MGDNGLAALVLVILDLLRRGAALHSKPTPATSLPLREALWPSYCSGLSLPSAMGSSSATCGSAQVFPLPQSPNLALDISLKTT